MKAIKWLFGHLEEVISTTLVIIVFIALGASIVGRWIGISTSGMQELYNYGFIVAILFGISFAARENDHIRADIITGNVSESLREKILFVADIIWFLFSLALAWYGFQYVQEMASFEKVTPILHMPLSVLHAMVPISAALTAIRIAQNHIEKFMKRKAGRST
ncbi:MAG TPA: TRAP transporter small permease subunit [Virgibacillus sp.]|nr:TRAP transporter small permease subunit [Virgibacillus sp.]